MKRRRNDTHDPDASSAETQAEESQIKESETGKSSAAGNQTSAAAGIPTADSAAPEAPGEFLAIREELADARAEILRLQARLLEATADLDNQAKRFRRESQLVREQMVRDFATKMLEVLDNLDRALEAVPETERRSSIAQGVTMVQQLFREKLAGFNIEPIETLNRPFDPRWHEALFEEPRSDVAAGTIVAELTRGYRMGDRLVRAAKVRVAQTPPAPT